MSHQNDSSDKRTVVDEGTTFEGKLSSSCPIDVRGRIDGDVSTPSLTISKHGAVHGRVKVGSVRSEGEIAGEFEADHVELAGSVKDNTVIRARSLEVKLSAERGRLQVIFGECELSVGDEPTEHVELPVQVEQAIAAQANDLVAPLPEAPLQLLASAHESAAAELTAPRDPEAASAAAPNLDAAALAEAATELDDDSDDDDATMNPAGASEPKPRRRRKGKNGASEDAPVTGWSQPPSQPPPAS